MTRLSAKVVASAALFSIAAAGDSQGPDLANRQLQCGIGYYNCNNVCLPNNAVCAVAPTITVVAVSPPATVTAVIPGPTSSVAADGQNGENQNGGQNNDGSQDGGNNNNNNGGEFCAILRVVNPRRLGRVRARPQRLFSPRSRSRARVDPLVFWAHQIVSC